MLGGTHQALDNFIPLIAAGALPFSVGKKYQCRGGTTRPWAPLKNNKKQRINPTAAPAAMKDSARAGVVIAAPVNAGERWTEVQWMNDWFKIELSFPVFGVSYLPFKKLLTILERKRDIKGLCP